MPTQTKIDPFKPAQPAIPGVAPKTEAQKATIPPGAEQQTETPQAHKERASSFPVLKVGATIAGLAIAFAGVFYWARSYSRVVIPAAAEETDSSVPAIANKPLLPDKFPVGPGPIGTTEELAKAWSFKRFLFRDSTSGDKTPAMVVRLPGGELWGFSLREPFGQCELEYVTDLKRIANEYHFQANHPMVANPCSRAVYDLGQYSNGALNGGIVRGAVVSGIAVRPPMAIEIRTEGKSVVAVRSE